MSLDRSTENGFSSENDAVAAGSSGTAYEAVPLQIGAVTDAPPPPPTNADARKALDNFAMLLHGLDFNNELAMLGVGRLRFIRRRRLRNEFKALTMGLWRLALERSFPDHFQSIFETFLRRKLEALDSPQKAEQFEQTVRNYLVLLEKKRESDFTEVGAHLASLVKLPERQSAPLRLRLALHIRSLYTLVFDRLI